MIPSWKTLPFNNAIEDCSGGNKKTFQSEYLSKGLFPVIDQGKELIAGYVNDQSYLWKGKLPVVAFGDHTRSLKFLDFPFCMGADGLKILSAKDGIDQKYLFYYLSYLDIPSAGYSRHFKFLKEKSVSFPESLAEQKRIVAILDQIEFLRVKRRVAIDGLERLALAIFFEMFESDTDLSTLELNECLDFVTSGGRGWAKFYNKEGSRFIRSVDVQMNYISEEDMVFVTPPQNAEARRTLVKVDDVLLTITGSRIGRVAPAMSKHCGAFISQHVAILRLDRKKLDPIFLSYYLSLAHGGQRQIEKSQYGQTKPGLNFDQIRAFRIPDVPIRQQQEFCQRLCLIDEVKSIQRAHLAQLDALFASIQHRAFRGEL